MGYVGRKAGEVPFDTYDKTTADALFEPADATIVKDADIGVTVQGYDATIVVDADIGVTVQGYDVDTAKTDVVQAFTKAQSGAVVAANTGAIDLSLANNFSVTPTANVTIANPTNIVVGQSGSINCDASTYTFSFGTYWKFASGTAPTLTGNSILSYYVKSATEIVASEVLAYA